MKLAWGLLTAVGLFSPSPSTFAAATPPTPLTRINAHEYIRLADWAKPNAFDVHWLKKDESLQLTRGSDRLLLTVDSDDAQLNGVVVKLCYPIAAHEGAPWLSQIDAETTLRPLLSPPKNRAGARVRS